jgi:nitrate reductase beta subunit
MKAPAKTTEQPKAADVLTAIVDLAIPVRYPGRIPTLSDLARLVSAASRVLHVRDLDERIAVENAAVMVLAKKRGLVS